MWNAVPDTGDFMKLIEETWEVRVVCSAVHRSAYWQCYHGTLTWHRDVFHVLFTKLAPPPKPAVHSFSDKMRSRQTGTHFLTWKFSANYLLFTSSYSSFIYYHFIHLNLDTLPGLIRRPTKPTTSSMHVHYLDICYVFTHVHYQALWLYLSSRFGMNPA